MNQSIEQQLADLRAEWPTATPERRAEIEELAETLRLRACRECRKRDQDDEHYPFCSQECNEEWGAKNAPTAGPEGKKLTIEQMQQRLLDIAEEKRIARLSG